MCTCPIDPNGFLSPNMPCPKHHMPLVYEENIIEFGPQEGTFMWAVEQMKKGEKLIRYSKSMMIFSISEDRIKVYHGGHIDYYFTLDDFQATDWVIIGLKK